MSDINRVVIVVLSRMETRDRERFLHGLAAVASGEAHFKVYFHYEWVSAEVRVDHDTVKWSQGNMDEWAPLYFYERVDRVVVGANSERSADLEAALESFRAKYPDAQVISVVGRSYNANGVARITML